MDGAFCSFPDCGEEAQRYGLCWGHAKQKQRGRALTPLREAISPEEAVLVAGSDWLEADEDEEHAQAKAMFLLRAERWLRSRGWRPPVPSRRACCCGLVQLELPLRHRRASTVAGIKFSVRAT